MAAERLHKESICYLNATARGERCAIRMRTEAAVSMEKLALREGQRIALLNTLKHSTIGVTINVHFGLPPIDRRFIDIADALYVAHSPCISIPIGALQ
jgi:hypothetical protein